MASPTYNPYRDYETLFTDGLDYIVTNLTPPVNYYTITDLVTAYFNSLPTPPGPEQLQAFSRLAINSGNDYINSRIAGNLNYNANEWAFVESVLGGLKENSIDSYDSFLEDAQEQLAQADFNTPSKTALYVALALTRASNTYWNTVVTTPGSWATYINSNAAINYANIPHWVSATFVGVLSGFAQIQDPNMPNSGILTSQGRYFAAEGSVWSALGVTVGKVILRWAKRPVGGSEQVTTIIHDGQTKCNCEGR